MKNLMEKTKVALARMGRFTFKWSLIIFIVYCGFQYVQTLRPEQVEASTTITQVVQAEAPVLDRIADCESGNGKPGSATHYKNGQVLLKANTNGTIDAGKYQVNLTYWGKKASELHLDLTKEEDNKKMAEWIYLNKGTGDWSASQKCWKR